VPTPLSSLASRADPGHAIEAQRLALDRIEVPLARVGVELDVGHVQRFEIAAHRRQRRLQLVRHVGEHLAAQAIGGAQRLVPRAEIGRHPVEGDRDAGDFIAAGFGRTRRQVAAAEPLRRRLQRVQAPPGGAKMNPPRSSSR